MFSWFFGCQHLLMFFVVRFLGAFWGEIFFVHMLSTLWVSGDRTVLISLMNCLKSKSVRLEFYDDYAKLNAL